LNLWGPSQLIVRGCRKLDRCSDAIVGKQQVAYLSWICGHIEEFVRVVAPDRIVVVVPNQKLQYLLGVVFVKTPPILSLHTQRTPSIRAPKTSVHRVSLSGIGVDGSASYLLVGQVRDAIKMSVGLAWIEQSEVPHGPSPIDLTTAKWNLLIPSKSL
jgi:hypothetical protein